MQRVAKTGKGKYRFWFLGMPMTFTKLRAYFNNKPTAYGLRAVWHRKGRPFKIKDPEFFAAAVNARPYSYPVEVLGHGTFPSMTATAKAFGVSVDTVENRVAKANGCPLHPDAFIVDREIWERIRKGLEAKRIAEKKAKLKKTPRRSMPSDEWLAFTDKPRRQPCV